MKVLHLSTYDGGGAGRAVYRLHHGLLASGISSQMLVERSQFQDEPAITTARSGPFSAQFRRLRFSGEFVPNKLYPHREKTSFSSQWLPEGIAAQVARLDPTVINLHWINHGFVQVESIAKLKRPLVWTLHDMWPFTGGCHYSGQCDRYTHTCGQCPLLHSSMDRDLSRWIWSRKAKAWANIPFTIVTPSHWLADCARSSALFKSAAVEVIPHGLDLQAYQPIDKATAREQLGLPLDKKIILFGALNATKDARKGFSKLAAALEILSRQPGWQAQAELVVFGASELSGDLNLGFKAQCLGHLGSDAALASAYSAADVMIVPSVQEAFGQTAFESLACGTPVVAFNATGLKDIVTHQQDGYLARPFEVDDLAGGISWVLADGDRHRRLCRAARDRAEREFSLEQQAKRYAAVFERVAAEGARAG